MILHISPQKLSVPNIKIKMDLWAFLITPGSFFISVISGYLILCFTLGIQVFRFQSVHLKIQG